MSKRITPHSATTELITIPGLGIMLAYGDTVPIDTAAGYGPGCIFIDTNAAAGSRLLCNDGSVTSADFDIISVA